MSSSLRWLPVKHQHASILQTPPAHQLPQTRYMTMPVLSGDSVYRVNEESGCGVHTGQVVSHLSGPQHSLDTVGSQFVPFGTICVAQAQTHLLLLSVHGCCLLQRRNDGPLALTGVNCLDIIRIKHMHCIQRLS